MAGHRDFRPVISALPDFYQERQWHQSRSFFLPRRRSGRGARPLKTLVSAEGQLGLAGPFVVKKRQEVRLRMKTFGYLSKASSGIGQRPYLRIALVGTITFVLLLATTGLLVSRGQAKENEKNSCDRKRVWADCATVCIYQSHPWSHRHRC